MVGWRSASFSATSRFAYNRSLLVRHDVHLFETLLANRHFRESGLGGKMERLNYQPVRYGVRRRANKTHFIGLRRTQPSEHEAVQTAEVSKYVKFSVPG